MTIFCFAFICFTFIQILFVKFDYIYDCNCGLGEKKTHNNLHFADEKQASFHLQSWEIKISI